MYVMGIILALVAGICFNTGYLLQKTAIERGDKSSFRFTALLARPLWLAGIFLQVGLGTPFYAMAQLYLGPSLVPGLMAAGIIVLVIGSQYMIKETLTAGQKLGLGLIVAAIFFIGLSGLDIDLTGYNFFASAFLYRLLFFNISYFLLLALLLPALRLYPRFKSLFQILASSLFFALSNLWLALVMGFWGRFAWNVFSMPNLWYFLLAAGVTFFTSLSAIYLTQQALRTGKVSVLIPIQNIPIQVTPVILYFMVFALPAGTWFSFLYLTLGISGIVSGSFLLLHRRKGLLKE